MEDIQKFLATAPNEGIHEFEKYVTLPMGRLELFVNNNEIAAAAFDIKYHVRVVRTAVVSQFRLEGRGRYIQAQNVKCGDFEIPVEIVIVNPHTTDK